MILKTLPSWPLRKFLTTNLDRSSDGAWSWQINLPVLTAALPELEKNPLRDTDRYTGPVRFIAGEKSSYIESADHAAIREHFPAAEIVAIANSAHNPHMEAREAFVAAVLAPLAPASG